MLKISRKASTMLSMILSIGFLLLMILISVFMKQLVWSFIDLRYPGQIMLNDRIYIMIIGYCIGAIGIVAASCLIILLKRVSSSLVFSDKSTALVRCISWCAILMGIMFILLGKYFTMAYVAAFAGIFLGLCVRVVKNVIEEATAIKNENDLTI